MSVTGNKCLVYTHIVGCCTVIVTLCLFNVEQGNVVLVCVCVCYSLLELSI